MAFNAFLKLDGIPGESLDAKHKDEIEVISYSWGALNTGSTRGGGSEGKVSFTDFMFLQRVSRASPVLMKACATGEHIKEATIVFRKAGSGQQEYLKITMSEILVTRLDAGGTADGQDEIPTESVSLNFAKVKVAYTRPGTTNTFITDIDLTQSTD